MPTRGIPSSTRVLCLSTTNSKASIPRKSQLIELSVFVVDIKYNILAHMLHIHIFLVFFFLQFSVQGLDLYNTTISSQTDPTFSFLQRCTPSTPRPPPPTHTFISHTQKRKKKSILDKPLIRTSTILHPYYNRTPRIVCCSIISLLDM